MAPLRSSAAREALLAEAGSSLSMGGQVELPRDALKMSAPLAQVLPEGGFPRGGVVELASPANLGRGVSVALAACAASQKNNTLRGAEKGWCVFLDPDHTLFGPAVQASGVALDRLLVLHPPRALLSKVAVRVAMSRIFSVIVVDVAGVPGASGVRERHHFESMHAWAKAARRLALAIEKTPTTLFLLTKLEAARPAALPVAMRIELENEGPESLSIRVAKEKFGRIASPRHIAWTRPPSSLDHPFAETANAVSG